MNKRDKIDMFIIIFIGVLVGTIATLGLFLLFILRDVVIDQESINLLDMYIKASFSFFGSVFSIASSLLIFHLQNNRKAKEEEKSKNLLLKVIQTKNEENLKEVDKIYRIISQKGISTFLEEFKENEIILKEIFLTIYTSINTDLLDTIILKLDPLNSKEAVLIEEYNIIKNIEKLLYLVVEKAQTEQGKNELLTKLFSLTGKAKKLS